MLKRNQPMLLERMGKMQSATDVAESVSYTHLTLPTTPY